MNFHIGNYLLKCEGEIDEVIFHWIVKLGYIDKSNSHSGLSIAESIAENKHHDMTWKAVTFMSCAGALGEKIFADPTQFQLGSELKITLGRLFAHILHEPDFSDSEPEIAKVPSALDLSQMSGLK